MDKRVGIRESLSDSFVAEKIFRDSLQENPGLGDISSYRRRSLIRTALTEILELEAVSGRPYLPETSEEARRIKWIWDFSGSGTYELRFAENDSYEGKEWAGFSDKRRLDRSAWFMRKVAEVASGQQIANMPLDEQRNIIREFSPTLIYNGTDEGNKAVLEQLERSDIIIPKEKVYVTGKGIERTIDQVKDFSFPPGYTPQKGDVGFIVSDAPHLIRIAHMLAQESNGFPSGLDIVMLPLGTPLLASTQQAQDEVRGLLYYTYIRKVASENAYPYRLR